MAFLIPLFSALLLLLCSQPLSILSKDNNPTPTLHTYIVQLHPESSSRSHYPSKSQWHLSFLEKSINPTSESPSSPSSFYNDPSSRILYSYDSAFVGFSALLTPSEVSTLESLHHEVVAVRLDTQMHLHTTYSYKFLGLTSNSPPTSSSPPSISTQSGVNNPWSVAGFGRGTIIGVLDTGVWPESPSFNDHGMNPPPKRWRGVCQEGQNFNASNCNNKLIGARFFIKGHRVASTSSIPGVIPEYVSPRDSSGHGTHTSSTAGGSPVTGANVLGNGAGEARGMALGAHIAVYKVCWYNGCYSSDILAAMDAAIKDGVNVLSLSLGGFPVPLYDDVIAIGSFRAVENGISVVCAAGNNGPIQSSVANEAPWITTVGASTLDRRFPAFVRMGNGQYLYGESMYPGKHLPGVEKELEVVYLSGRNTGSEYCGEGSLPRSIVQGKLVVCDRGINGRAEKGEVVKKAGGLGMILANTEVNLEEDSVDVHVLPATLIGYDESVRLKTYISDSTSSPIARIVFAGTIIGRSRAPALARFSSRGPSLNNPSVLKPDLIAPGVNIIAAWPQNLGPTGLADDQRRVNFTVMSGTSMSCPHVSGISALVHSAHRNWSPAAVKSALITTADTADHYGKPIMDGSSPATIFAMGAGHVNPAKAINPGLVYDIRPDEYVTHLCTLGYTKSEIFTITHKNVSCEIILKRNKGFSLNYPSISVTFKQGMTRAVVRRRLTNVGRPDSTYLVEVAAPKGVKLTVKPKQLVFERTHQTLSYKVYFVSTKKDAAGFGQGSLTWGNYNQGCSKVRSPVSVTWKK